MSATHDPGLPNITILLDPPHPHLLTALRIPPESEALSAEMTNLERMDARLAGLTAILVGRRVPVTIEIPDYPFLRLPGVPIPYSNIEFGELQLQVYLWRLSKPPAPLYAELRWNPQEGETFGIGGLTSADGFRVCQEAWSWVKVMRREVRRGRPYGDGYYASDADALISAGEAIRRIPKGHKVTRKAVLKRLGITRNEIYLTRLCKRNGMTFPELVNRVRSGRLN